MRWPLFVSLTLCVGLVQMLGRAASGFPAPGVHLELLFLIGFHTALRGSRGNVVVALWWCGLVQDLFFGTRLGVNALLYMGAAVLVGFLHGRVLSRHLLTRVGLVFVLLLALLTARQALAAHVFHAPGSAAVLRLIAASAFYSALASPLVGLLLRTRALRTWKQPDLTYGLPGDA